MGDEDFPKAKRPETVWDERERAVIGGTDWPNLNPDGGIVCPWNRDEHGPAKERISQCLVWRNDADFDRWASEGNHYFCRVHCQYGRNPEVARRNREIRDRQVRVPGWMKAMTSPPDFMFPPQRKRIA
jgi:hypothetical protein